MDVAAWVAKVRSPVKAIVEKVRALVREAVPDVVEEIKWGRPVFSKNGLLCYVKPYGSYVAFGFFAHKAAMRDPEGLLEGGSDGGHVKLKSDADIRPELFREWVKSAAERNARA